MDINFTREQAERFLQAEPFPHLVADGVFPAAAVAAIEREFPPIGPCAWIRMNNEWEFKFANERPFTWGRTTVWLMSYLNSPPFIEELERLTGIDGLIPDPTFRGGGLHLIPRGGFLKVHTDFSHHNGRRRGQGWRRRLNLLLYLNSNWPDEWGGHLELWDVEGKRAVRQIAPVFNRVVIFSTSERSFHGHPRPLACPPDRARKSLALYYYTKENAEHEESHSTNFVRS